MKNISVLFFLLLACTFYPIKNSSAQSEFSNPTIQIGVVVKDLQKSVEFYTRIIGMTKTGEFSVPVEKARELGLTDKYPLDVTVLKLENSEQANEWKLMSLGTKANHPKQNFISDDTGIQYITILVEHLLPVMKRVQQNRIKILSKTPSTLDDGRKFILIQDPDGTFVEIIGPE